MTMRCDEAQQLISDCMDDGQTLGPELRRHVSGCTVCAEFERDCRELDVLLTAGRAGAPVAGPRWRVGKVLVVAVLAAAAVFVLALLPFWRLNPRRNPDPTPNRQQVPQIGSPDIAGFTSQMVERVAVAPIRQEMTSLVADARSATRSILSCLPSPSMGTSTRAVQ
jgi:hypothetical protein